MDESASNELTVDPDSWVGRRLYGLALAVDVVFHGLRAATSVPTRDPASNRKESGFLQSPTQQRIIFARQHIHSVKIDPRVTQLSEIRLIDEFVAVAPHFLC